MGGKFRRLRLLEEYPEPSHYKMAFAFSLVFCPPEDSAEIPLGLLIDFDFSIRLFRIYPVVSTAVFEIVEPPPRRKGWLSILR